MKGFRQFTENNNWKVAQIKQDLAAHIKPYEGVLYHGTPLLGAACIAQQGFKPGHHQELGGEFLSLSRNGKVLRLFSHGDYTGFEFEVNFPKVLFLPEFYYALLTHDTGMSLWDDLVEQDPEIEEKAKSLGFNNRWGNYGIEDGWVFWSAVMPAGLDAVAIDHHDDFRHENAEAEIAITEYGCRKLKDMVSEIIVKGKYLQPEEGWRYLMSIDIKNQNCDSTRDY